MILQAAKIIGSGLATIGLAGAGVGILRLNNYNRENKNNLILLSYSWIICRQSNANGLFEVAEFNEVLLQGLMNNQKESIAISRWCSDDIATIECIAKAKYHFKKGSTPRYKLFTLKVISACPFEKVINWFLNYTIDSLDLSLTDTYFTIVHNSQEIVYLIIIKSGNLGQVDITGLAGNMAIEGYRIKSNIERKVIYSKFYKLSMTFLV